MNIRVLYRSTLGAIMMAAFVAILGVSVPAHAQSTGDAAQGIEISPALVELNGEPGKTYTLKIKVTNVTLTKLTYTTSINDFTSQGETGSPRVLIDDTLPATASVTSWIAALPGFTLDTRESRNLTATVTIPADAEPGGHYGVIRFSGRPPALEDSGVGLSASAGMLLLIRVAGDISETASLESFYSANNGNQTSLFESSPIGFVTRIKNDGNIHVKPVGTIEITDMFGNLVGSVPVNDTKSNALPDSIRRFDGEFKADGWMIGAYTANLTIGYGTTGQAITNTITFWVIPYKLLAVVILGLITLVFIASRLIKVYNRRIIAKAKNENTTKNKKNDKKKG